jgi:deoxyhypusine synthase
VSWGKIDPDTLPDCVVCYADSTITLPLLTAYALDRVKPRPLKRLYAQRDSMLEAIRLQYLRHGTVDKIAHRTDLDKPKKGRSGRSVTGTARGTKAAAPKSRKATGSTKGKQIKR